MGGKTKQAQIFNDTFSVIVKKMYQEQLKVFVLGHKCVSGSAARAKLCKHATASAVQHKQGQFNQNNKN